MTISPYIAPAFLRLSTLSDDVEQLRRRLVTQLSAAQRYNERQIRFYEGAQQARDLGIAIPPHLKDLEAVAGWPEICVDVVDERSDWRGWHTFGTDLGLDDVYEQNHLGIELGQATLDALICGPGFMTVGTGAEGEPEILVRAESPSRMTVTWSRRLRRPVNGLTELFNDEGHLTGWRIYVPGETITTEIRDNGLIVTDRDEHGRERIPIAVIPNRPQTDRPLGRSEITRAVRSFTESGMRTLLGMEVSREFYAAPQRFLMGADESMFVDSKGEPVGQWAAIIGKMLMAPRDEDGNLPQPGVFQSASPQPFTDLLRTYSQMVSASTGIPAHHLGFTTDNPASEGSIRRADARLDKRAVKRHKHFDIGLISLGELVVLWRDNELPEPGAIGSRWEPVETPSPGAQADRAGKMIASGVLSPDWDFTLKQYGLSDDEVREVQRERLLTRGREARAQLGQAAAAARGQIPAPGNQDADVVDQDADPAV